MTNVEKAFRKTELRPVLKDGSKEVVTEGEKEEACVGDITRVLTGEEFYLGPGSEELDKG